MLQSALCSCRGRGAVRWPRLLLGLRSSKCFFSGPSHGGHTLPESPWRWPGAVPGCIPGPMETPFVSHLCLSIIMFVKWYTELSTLVQEELSPTEESITAPSMVE